MRIQLKFFASLRETLNVSAEVLDLTQESLTVAQLKQLLVLRGEPWSEALAQGRAVRVAVNPGNAQRVQSIQYLPGTTTYTIANATDVQFDNSANNNSILTYDNTTNKFVVQNAPRLNGGTF